MHIVNCWSDDIWCPTESRDVSESQLALLLASCSVLFELWLVACHSVKDLRELFRSTGLRWCVSLIMACSPSHYGFFHLAKGWNNVAHTDHSISVCVCVCAPVCTYMMTKIPIDVWSSSPFLFPLRSFPPSRSDRLHSPPSCFIAVGPHTPAICGYALEVLFAL